jgi:deoxyguanosine kinase
VPGRRRGLGAVEGIGVCDALAPAGRAVVAHGDQDEFTCRHPPEARLEGAHERQAQHGQIHGADSHLSSVPHPAILRPTLEFRYLALDGPIGLGKTVLAERLGARLEATVVRDEGDNPFLADFYGGRQGAAFQAQLFFTLARHRQLTRLRQANLFSQTTICDYVFERDRIYAFMTLDDNELFIYQRLFDLVSRDVPAPDLVVYLQTPTDLLKRRLRDRLKRNDEDDDPLPTEEYLGELNEAYNHYFFHYTATPLLVVETSQLDLTWGEDTVDDLLKQLRTMGAGTRYYVPRT